MNNNPPPDSFWSVPTQTLATHAKTHDGSSWCLGTCPDHPAITDPVIEKLREDLANYVIFDDRPVDENGEPEYFDMFGSDDEKPQRCYNQKYKAPSVTVFPGVHYRDVRYKSVSAVSKTAFSYSKPNVTTLLLLCMFLCIVCR